MEKKKCQATFYTIFYTLNTKSKDFYHVFESLTQAHTPEQLSNRGKEKPEISHHPVTASRTCEKQSSCVQLLLVPEHLYPESMHTGGGPHVLCPFLAAAPSEK